MLRSLVLPFLLLFAVGASAQTGGADGDVIRLTAGSPSPHGMQLKRGQALIGEAGAPAITGTVTLGGDNRIENVSIASGAMPALAGGGSLGKVALHDVRVTMADGDGLVLTDAAGEIAWTGGGVSGRGTAIRVTGGSGKLSLTNAPIDVTDATAVIAKSSAMSIALSAVSDRGADQRIGSAIVVDKVSGGFSVDGGTITKMFVRAISVTDSSNVILRNMTLRDNAANGSSALACGGAEKNFGSAAGCNAAIYLNGARSVTIDGVTVDLTSQIGINGVGVAGLTMTNTKVGHAGNEDYEHAIQFENISGNVVFSHVKVTEAASRALSIGNDQGTAHVEIADSSFGQSAVKTGTHGLHVVARGTAQLDVTVAKSAFEHVRGSAVDAASLGRGSLTIAVRDCTFRSNSSAVTLAMKDDATLRYTIAHNDSTGNRSAAIAVTIARPSTGTATGTITANVVGHAGADGSGAICGTCTGIALRATGNGHLVSAVTDNTVRQVDGYGISVAAADGAPSVDVTITGNHIYEPANADALNGIHLQSGAGASESAALCATIGGAGALANEISAGWPAGGIMLENQYAASTFRIAGFSGDGANRAAVAAYVSGMNRRTSVEPLLATAPDKSAFTGGAACSVP